MRYTYSFEKMHVWQLARQVVKVIYLKTKSFPKEELFGITSQIRRASISVCCNLAEGSSRVSAADQNRFYEIAFSSAVEVVNLLVLCFDLELLTENEYVGIRTELEKLTFQINKLSGKRPPNSLQEPESPFYGQEDEAE